MVELCSTQTAMSISCYVSKGGLFVPTHCLSLKSAAYTGCFLLLQIRIPWQHTLRNINGVALLVLITL
jgi:hypothetical protein